MKKIISVFTAFILLALIFVPAYADASDYILDELGYIHDEEIAEYNEMAGDVYLKFNIAVYFAITKTLPDGMTANETAEQLYDDFGNAENGVIFLDCYDAENYGYFAQGAADEIFDRSTMQGIVNLYNSTSTYADGAFSYVNEAEAIIRRSDYAAALSSGEGEETTALVEDIMGESETQITTPIVTIGSVNGLRVVDNAGLLTQSEYNELLKQVNEISERQNFDVVIVTEDSISGTTRDYADDFYDYNGYGPDGALLLIVMDSRDWYISTTGYGITAITDAGRKSMENRFVGYLSNGEYKEGFSAFAELCDEYVTQAKSGNPYDTGNLPKESFAWGKNIIIALLVGIVIALIVTFTMKGKLKTVRAKENASDYTVPGSMNVTYSRDIFLYSQISRTEIPRNTSSGGGSSTHTSSSGSSHGGGGGHF